MSEGLLVNVEELENSYGPGTTFDTAASVVAFEASTLAQATLESWLGRPATVRAFTDSFMLSQRRTVGGMIEVSQPDALYFPATPVESITSVTVDDVAAAATTYRRRSFGMDTITFTGTEAVVAYTAGWDGRHRDNNALKMAVMRAARREVKSYEEGDFDVKDVRDEGYAAKFVSPESVFTGQELALCLRFKRKKAAFS